ncbi:MAG TPA: C45 family peptidase [Terriglobales bacterium]
MRSCRFALLLALGIAALPVILVAANPDKADARLKNAYRFERAHWIYAHLEGTPSQIGFQHGYLLAPEIDDAFKAVKYRDVRRVKRDWNFFRETAEKIMWPHIETEYREELQGIADGLKAKGVQMDLWDVVALNAMEELGDYYVAQLDKQQKRAGAPHLVAPGNCSAFVATGSWTKDGRPVIAHNNWTGFAIGARWRVIFDIVPTHGYRILMDGFPGIITSDDDFGINAAGMMITETTITNFEGYDPKGIPEFVRARKAMQYADSIDKYVDIMLKGNNGGYANDWLLADTRTGEIAQFELGLKVHRLWRTKDGYYAGSNFPSDPELIAKEAHFDLSDLSNSPNARHKRWDALLTQNKGKIDAELAQKFLADHFDTFENKEQANDRALCGHNDVSRTGIKDFAWPPYYPGGAVNAKVADSTMAKNMTLRARAGRACGEDFIAADFLKAHPEFEEQRPILIDMKGNPWADFKTSDSDK